MLLQTEHGNVHGDAVDSSGNLPDPALGDASLSVPDPDKSDFQSTKQPAPSSSQAAKPSASEQQPLPPKSDAKSVTSKLPKVLQRKKHSETEL